MQFEKGHLYHIYNQGNNRRKIFFSDENYLFFLKKIRTHILPFADIIAYCLMPNHFHLMVFVNEVELPVKVRVSGSATQSRTPTNLNKSIGILLASYTRAINKQNNTSGSLFRSKTKAECLDNIKSITPSFFTKNNTTQINIAQPELQYPQVCFNYIHSNPTRAKLSSSDEEWIYSSAKEYQEQREGSITNQNLARKLLNIT